MMIPNLLADRLSCPTDACRGALRVASDDDRTEFKCLSCNATATGVVA